MTTLASTPVLAFLLALVAACGESAAPGHLSGGDATVFAVASDYAAAGVASTVSLPTLELVANVIDGVASADPVVRALDQLYVVNRTGADNVTVIDPATLQLVEQVSTEGGSNPQDVAVLDGRLYVVGLGLTDVLAFDLADLAGGIVDRLAIGALDVDGFPDCNSIVAAGDRLLVACGRLDADFAPRGAGVVGIVEPGVGLVGQLELPYANPFGFARALPDGGVALSTAPDFADLSQGCLARVDVADGATTGTAACLIDNAELGGYVSGMAATDDALWLAVVAGFDPDDLGALGALRRYDLAAGTLGEVVSSDDQRVFDVAACPTGDVAVADAAGGLRVYDAGGAEATGDLLDLGLPPVQQGVSCY